jgi:GH18 family chitinase
MHGGQGAKQLLSLLLYCSAPAWARPRVVAYVPNWVELTTFAGTIEYARLTHINIAFENPVSDEGDLSLNKKDSFVIDKARAAGVKVLVSIGGGSAATDKRLQARYFKLIGAERRAAFIAKLVEYVVANRFDGLDVDIEGPSINKDYSAFVRDLGKAMHAKEKLLTAALSKGYGGKNVPDSALAAFDFVNIMAYDATGHWGPQDAGAALVDGVCEGERGVLGGAGAGEGSCGAGRAVLRVRVWRGVSQAGLFICGYCCEVSGGGEIGSGGQHDLVQRDSDDQSQGEVRGG